MRLWIVGSAAIVSVALAFSGHGIGAQFPSERTSDQTGDYSFTLPQGYRDWVLISVAAVGPPLNDIRAKLGNDIAMSDLRQATIPYRDGAIIARLAWRQTTDPQTSNAFRLQAQQAGMSVEAIAKLLSQSFVAGPAANVQFMVKDSKKYASTGGWGFFQFTNGKSDAVVHQNCFACHAPAKVTDFVFTRYSP
jgi:hypothetical protein